jgi:hypothetical protein
MTGSFTPASNAEQRERTFLIRMALFALAVVLFGFVGNIVRGASSFAVPWFYHVHAIPLMSWILLVVVQSWLAKEDNFSLHGRLGWLGVGLGIVIFSFGLVFPIISGAYHVETGTPPVPAYAAFLILNIFNFLQIGAWLLIGFLWRKKTDWHRRAMHIVTLLIVLVAWNRVWEIFGFEGHLHIVLTQLALIAHFIIYMVGDKIIRGRIHPAYFWGLGAFCLEYLCFLTVGETVLGDAMLRAIAP